MKSLPQTDPSRNRRRAAFAREIMRMEFSKSRAWHPREWDGFIDRAPTADPRLIAEPAE